MRKILAATIAVLWSATIAYAADPVGTYTMKGKNPGNSGSYSGTVSITKTGETYQVVWVIGKSRYVGTGIGDKDFLAVSYKSGDSTGLALYGADGGNWAGVWAYSGGREMGAEIWSRE